MVQALAVSATSLNFGSFTVGSSSSAQIVTISNGRAGSFALGSLAIGRANTRDFSLATTCALTLAPAADCAINVVFTPSGAGARTAALFEAGNVAGGFLTVALSGSGRATAPAPSIQAIVDAWNYTPGIAPGLWVSISGANLGAFAQTANFAGLAAIADQRRRSHASPATVHTLTVMSWISRFANVLRPNRTAADLEDEATHWRSALWGDTWHVARTYKNHRHFEGTASIQFM